jgi:putative transposase
MLQGRRRSVSGTWSYSFSRSDSSWVLKTLAALRGRLCIKFDNIYTLRLQRNHKGFGNAFFLDEVFVKINGKQHYLWRAVDQESLRHERSECFGNGEVVDVYLQSRRSGATAKRFFKRILKRHGGEPRSIVADKLKSDGVAHRELIPDTVHNTDQHASNRAKQSHEATRLRERVMGKFKSVRQAQNFLDTHADISNYFNLDRQLVSVNHYRDNREDTFKNWERAVA